MPRPRLVLVTPALAAANNGNWQTAQRWARMLASDYRVELRPHWGAADDAADAAADPAVDPAAEAAADFNADATADPAVALLALHARRSAASIAAWRAAHPTRPLVVVLTGTDLYRDITNDADAQRSLALADRLVVLQPLGVQALPAVHRAKAEVCLQSAAYRGRPRAPEAAAVPPTRPLRALMVGHLRDEKSPQTLFAAARRLGADERIAITHIGAALDPALGDAARATMAACPQYRWLGPQPHGATLRRIRAADVLLHCSLMEGGAHVISEAIVRGTPVLASRIAGNLGLLGEDYTGVFSPGDDAALAAWLRRCRDDATMLPRLAQQCALRAPLFAPARERDMLRRMMAELLARPDPRRHRT